MNAAVSAPVRPPVPDAAPGSAAASNSVPQPVLTAKDFASDQEVRWCPGCGDYAILKTIQQLMPQLGVPRERVAFISGIGCAARFRTTWTRTGCTPSTGGRRRSRPG